LHAEVGVAPVHSQVEKSCPQRFQQSPPYSRGTRCPLLPTRTSRSLRDITHWQPTLWRSQLVRVVPRRIATLPGCSSVIYPSRGCPPSNRTQA
jgi:hypothetical protein